MNPNQPPAGTQQPGPFTAFAWRTGLVRPKQGRMLAGVCGALGRATNTDPVLWRVVLAVLAVFGGTGVGIYVAGWLLLPADGDTASPAEAVFGRGRSSTSAVLAVIGGVILLSSIGVLFSEPFRPGPWSIVLVGGALLLLLRDRRHTGDAPPTEPPAGAAMSPPPSPAAAPYPPAPSYPSADPYPSTPAYPAAAPFAPRGPFASPPAPPPPPPRRRRRERSRLGRLTISLTLVVVGGLVLINMAGVSIPATVYLCAALATVGLGLVIGAWYGRSRGLIIPGLILAAVAGATATTSIHGLDLHTENAAWAPTSVDQIQPSYRNNFGNATLDLSLVNFSGKPDVSGTIGTAAPVVVDVRITAGNLEIILPADVDVTINATVHAGNADVLGKSWGGLGGDRHQTIDLGADGPGGGQLTINATVVAGNLEVHR